MKKYINGQYIELTPEELAQMEAERRKWELAEKSRPLTESEVSRILITQQINNLSVDDNTALRMKEFYPTWEDCVANGAVEYDKTGFKFSYGDKLFSCVNANPTFQADWVPGIYTASLYTEICETHAGTLEDPIPYDGNMALTSGLYYIQDYVIYLCDRDTVNPVYNPLSELVGIYVTEV